jgi:hypothetical protein
VGDLNGDQVLDLTVSNRESNKITVLLGQGDGTFYPPRAYAAGSGESWSVALGDVNEDGRLDALVANPDSDKISILFNSCEQGP